MHKDYSQNGETGIVRKYFRGKVGRYLSIGENDGETLSNVYGLYMDGWRGVNIEPSARCFSKLKAKQPECTNFNAAIGVVPCNTIMYESGEHLGNGDHSLLSTLIPDEMKRWDKEVFTEQRVEVMNIEQVCPKGSRFDLLSIDIEGMELEVLPFIMDHIEIEMAIIEWNGKNKDRFDEIMTGYFLIHQNAENLIYGRNKILY